MRQGTSSRWAELEKIANLAELQTRLDKEATIQREKFPVKRLQQKTRLESFPELETSRRIYNTNDFDPNKAYTFLAKKTYTRKVSSVGTISHYGQVFSVGARYKAQYVQIKFDVSTKSWLIFDNEAQIKSVLANHLSKENILNLTVCQRTTITL